MMEFLNKVRVNVATTPMFSVWFNLVVFLINTMLIPAAWLSDDALLIVMNALVVGGCGYNVFINLDRIKENFNTY